MTTPSGDPDPTQTPLPESDPGDESGAVSGVSGDDTATAPSGAPDDQDPGGTDTQLAPDQD